VTPIPITILHKSAVIPTRRIRTMIPKIIRKESNRRIGSIGIIVVTDRRIRTINRRYLDHDFATDVVTFDLSDTRSSPLDGEIYISYDRAAIQARRYGVSIDNEVLRLIAHGVLHLLGYDDATVAERHKMLQLGDRYLMRNSA